MYKIGMIGDRDSVLGFLALGFSVHEATDAAEAGEILAKLVRSGEYAVILLTEALAMALEEQMKEYKDMPLPAVVSIPGQGGSTGYGMNAIRAAAERAVGADVLFRE